MSNADHDLEDRPDTSDGDEQARLAAQIELLAEENRRLRAEYARAKRSQYRRSALSLLGLGALAVLGGLLLPTAREVLFVLGATGLFVGAVIYFLTPSRFVAADVGERVYANLATNEASIVAELDLREDRIYLPGSGVRRGLLYVPQYPDVEPPADPNGTFLTDPDERGLALESTGSALFEEFERALTADLATTPEVLASQVADGLVEQFELARSVDPDVDAGDGRATFAVGDSAFGSVDRFDHPIASFVAASFAVALDRPVELDVVADEGAAEWLVTCRWDVDDES